MLSTRSKSRPVRGVLLAAVLALPACAADGGSAARSAGSGGSATPRATTATATTATAEPTATPTAAPVPEDLADAALARLDRAAQVAQLFVVGVPLDAGLADAGVALSGEGVGGVFLAGRSNRPADELAAITAAWLESAPGPSPWVAVDQEGGSVQTLSGPGLDRLPSAAVQGDLPADDLAELAENLGASLAGAGVTLNLAPVADVVPSGTEGDNRPIGYYARQYGGTAEEVEEAAAAVLAGLAEHGVTATLKHFPGLGRVRANTDDSAGVTDTVTGPTDPQVRLFAELADSPAHPFVMTSSATYARIDAERAATWSPVVIDDLLREDLGFDGVVISDDLGAAAAVQDVPPGQRAVRFLAAGGTLVLTVAPRLYPEMREAVLSRDRRDPEFRRQVDAAVRTALVAKARAGLLPAGD